MSRSHFILSAAANHLVQAYKSCIAEYQQVKPLNLFALDTGAPSTYAELKSDAERGFLAVSLEHCKTAIYGRDGNVTFRVFHDFGHILYDKEFTTQDEIALASMQWFDLKKHIAPEWMDICHTVYFADTVAQSAYEAEHGDFPADQKAFVKRIMDQQLRVSFPIEKR